MVLAGLKKAMSYLAPWKFHTAFWDSHLNTIPELNSSQLAYQHHVDPVQRLSNGMSRGSRMAGSARRCGIEPPLEVCNTE